MNNKKRAHFCCIKVRITCSISDRDSFLAGCTYSLQESNIVPISTKTFLFIFTLATYGDYIKITLHLTLSYDFTLPAIEAGGTYSSGKKRL